MTGVPPARPVSPLAREVTAAAAGQATLAAGGLTAALITVDGLPRALILWAVTTLVVGAAQAARAGWLASEPAPAVPAAARCERPGDTVRRTVVVLVPAVALQVAALLVGAGLGAIVAGVLTGTALGELRGRALVRRREAGGDGELLRELGGQPFAGPRRPLYTRPRSDSTLAT